MSATGVVGALPIMVFSFFVQKHLVRGLTMGAIKRAHGRRTIWNLR
jgi:ABC-type glycerol-3-phosphate transport system permease component